MNNLRIIAATAFLLVQAGIYYTISAKEFIPDVRPWNSFPAAVSGWKSAGDQPLEADVVAALKPDDYLNRYYVSGNRTVSLFVGYFNSRRDGRAPHSPEWCLPGAGWKTVSTRVVTIEPAGQRAFSANEYIVQKGLDRRLVVYWYHQGERAVSSEVAAQFLAVPDMILHGRTDTSLVRIIVPVAGDHTDASQELAFGFARDVYPLIRQQIR